MLPNRCSVRYRKVPKLDRYWEVPERLLVSNLCNPSDAVRTMNKPDQRCPNWSALNRSKELLNSSFIKFCCSNWHSKHQELVFPFGPNRAVETERSAWTELNSVPVEPNRVSWVPIDRTETVRSDHTGPVAEPNRDSSVRSYRSGS